jgi:hypothetical protein
VKIILAETVRTGNGFIPTRVRYAEKFLEKDAVLCVIPVPNDDSVFVIVCINLLGRVNDQGCAKAVYILTLIRSKRVVELI